MIVPLTLVSTSYTGFNCEEDDEYMMECTSCGEHCVDYLSHTVHCNLQAKEREEERINSQRESLGLAGVSATTVSQVRWELCSQGICCED